MTTTLTPVSLTVLHAALDAATDPKNLCGPACQANQAVEDARATSGNYSEEMLADESHPDPAAQTEIRKLADTQCTLLKKQIGAQISQFRSHIQTYQSKYYAQHEMNSALLATTAEGAAQTVQATQDIEDHTRRIQRHAQDMESRGARLEHQRMFLFWIMYCALITFVVAQTTLDRLSLDGTFPTSAGQWLQLARALISAVVQALLWLLVPYAIHNIWKIAHAFLTPIVGFKREADSRS